MNSIRLTSKIKNITATTTIPFLYLLLFTLTFSCCVKSSFSSGDSNDDNLVLVNKCCEKWEAFVDSECVHTNSTSDSLSEKIEPWIPVFSNERGEGNIQVKYKFLIGKPLCHARQSWPVYQYPGSIDRLVLLENGHLRHYAPHPDIPLYDEDDHEAAKNLLYFDHKQGHYCMDKAISTVTKERYQLLAFVCSPEEDLPWTDSDFIVRKIVNPVFHGISIVILLIVAIVYFVLPTLRDLVGNIITTMTLCLIVSQIADLVRIFTEFSSHVSFFVADTILYISLMSTFLWLTGFGYYIWKTFRSRNVFLRVTDARKYCWYSGYIWAASCINAVLAIFSHVFLETEKTKQENKVEGQEIIGWLGISIFFTPIAICVLINVWFCVSTMKLINRRNVYGRIQQKLKANFTMFSLLFAVMTTAWLFLVFSLFKNEGLLYAHIVVNSIQAPLILYICVLRQKNVTFLLKKSCCYDEPATSPEWGDEMNYITTSLRTNPKVCDEYN